MKKIAIFTLILLSFFNINSMENDERNLGSLNIFPSELIGKILSLVIKENIDNWTDLFNFNNDNLKQDLENLSLVSKHFMPFTEEELKNFIAKHKQKRLKNYFQKIIKAEYNGLTQKKLDSKLYKEIEYSRNDLENCKESVKLIIAGAHFSPSTLDRLIFLYSSPEGKKILSLSLISIDDIENLDKWNYSIVCAALDGHIEIVKFLINSGADVNIQSGYGPSSLHYAAQKGHIKIVELLLDKGANINIKRTNGCGETPLMDAIFRGDRDAIIELLINRGADIDIQTNIGETALMKATWQGNIKAVKLLIDKGADVNKTYIDDAMVIGGSALMGATIMGHANIVELLINNGADVNIKDNKGKTCLEIALQRDNIEIVKLLEDKTN